VQGSGCRVQGLGFRVYSGGRGALLPILSPRCGTVCVVVPVPHADRRAQHVTHLCGNNHTQSQRSSLDEGLETGRTAGAQAQTPSRARPIDVCAIFGGLLQVGFVRAGTLPTRPC